jgi:hypothetical protein
MYEAQAVLDEFFDAGHYMKKHDPTLPVEGRFYGWGLATMTGKRSSTQTTALKSGVTLTEKFNIAILFSKSPQFFKISFTALHGLEHKIII